MGLVRNNSRQLRIVAVVAAAVTGFGGAAAVDALAGPPLVVASDFGTGDGLTRYVVTAAGGEVTPELLAALDGAAGVDSAQRLFDGTALVAVDALAPQQLRAVPGVATVETSPSVPVLGTASDPYYAPYAWHLENTGGNAYAQTSVTADADIDGSDGWDAATGAGLVVAVVDTGFDSDHPDLAGSLWTNPAETCGATDVDGNGLAGDCHGWNFTTNSPDVDNGAAGTHGASVAGVIGARKDNGVGSVGVAPEVTLMPLVVGSGEGIDVNLGAQAIRYAADHGADVVNASWGGAVNGTALTNLRAAVSYAASKGVLVVAAAGNDSGNRDTAILYPASLTESNVVTVGNSTAADTVAPSSAYGATSVDLFAPGTYVVTTWNDGGYRLVSGTSIAAPQVAAALALYRATMPTASIDELRAALLADVDPVAAFAGKSVSGGRLNVGRLSPGAAATVGYQFSEMSGPVGALSPQVRATGPAVAGTYSVVLGLGMEHGGEVWALSGEPVTVAGTTFTTDDAGQVTVPLGDRTTVDGLEVSPTVDLAQGRYALSVQLLVDGQPLGATKAAPLLVGQVSPEAPDGTDGSGSDGTGSDGSDGTGSDGSGGSGSGGGTTPGSGDDGTDPGGTTGPGTGTGTGGSGTDGTGGSGSGGSGSDGSGDSGDGTEGPAAPVVTSPSPGDTGTGGSAEPGEGDGTDGGSGSGTDPDSGTGSGTTPGSGGTPGAGTDPGAGSGGGNAPDVVTYPEVGAFGLTSISPATVGTAGGTRVTVTGTNLPDQVRVRIGETRAATVVRSDGTSLVFQAPAMVAGRYDVFVFGATGTEASVLTGGLTYTDEPAAGGSTPDPGPDAPGSGTGGTPDDDSTPDDGTDGTDGGAGNGGGSSSGPAPVTTQGPNGERLVRSTAFRGLNASFWSLDCSTSCPGVQL